MKLAVSNLFAARVAGQQSIEETPSSRCCAARHAHAERHVAIDGGTGHHGRRQRTEPAELPGENLDPEARRLSDDEGEPTVCKRIGIGTATCRSNIT